MNTEDMKETYENIYGNEKTPSYDIELMEKKLLIALPEDFKKIMQFYSGGYMGGISHFGTLEHDSENIINETIKARKFLDLPENYIVLAEPPESLIIMDTMKTSQVLWIDSGSIENVSEKWESYAQFFQYLLDEELELMQ